MAESYGGAGAPGAAGAEPPGDPATVRFEIEPNGEIVRIIVTHENLPRA